MLPRSGVIRIMPGQAGIIISAAVKEGQIVKSGDVLFVLSGDRSIANSGETQKIISDLLRSRRDSYGAELKQSVQQSRQRINTAERRVYALELEATRTVDQISLQRRRVVLAEQSYSRYTALNETNYISAAQLQDKQAELLDQQQRLAELLRIQLSGQRDLATASADFQDLKLQSQRDKEGLKRNVTSVEQDLTESEARREIVVRAPQDGIITAITTELGQTVVANSALASILPAGAELEAEIYAPSRSAGFIKTGMPVLLRYQAYPYQKFGQYPAVVREVASTSLSSEQLGTSGVITGTSGEPLYRIRLKLEKQTVTAYGKALPLKSGMRVDASVVLEQRRLYEWVLDPLFTISGRL